MKHYGDAAVTLYLGDCVEEMAFLADESVDALVSDPPYGIGFMGREWDTFKSSNVASEFDLRQRKEFKEGVTSANIKGRKRSPAASPSQIQYDYSTTGLRAFQAWTEQWAIQALRVLKPGAHAVVCGAPRAYHRMASGLEDAGFEIRDCLAWLFGSGFPKSLNLGEGMGTALKPAHEPIVLARKPFKGTVAGNVAKFGTGALNIDATRIAAESRPNIISHPKDGEYAGVFREGSHVDGDTELGRWPANVVLDEFAAMVLDEEERTDDGGASRFYYVAKPSRAERDYGVEHFTPVRRTDGRNTEHNVPNLRTTPQRNFHPTVKPVELMRWLVKLVTPPDGVVLDPFLGSGTTGMACRYEQRRFIGIEREADYMAIAERRIAAVAPLFTEQPA